MIVVDASAVIEVILRTEVGRKLAGRVLDPRQDTHAPHLLDVEVTQVVRRFARAREVTDDRARAALEVLADLPVTRHPHGLLVPRMWELRHVMTAYDASYVTLAEVLDATLVTLDGRLAKTRGHRATIELVS